MARMNGLSNVQLHTGLEDVGVGARQAVTVETQSQFGSVMELWVVGKLLPTVTIAGRASARCALQEGTRTRVG